MKRRHLITTWARTVAVCGLSVLGLGNLSAQKLTVTPLGTDYSKKTVTFRVGWTGNTTPANRVWVWIDFCPVKGATAGTFAQAVITKATANAGSIDAASLNGRGFYVTTNPSTVTATLKTNEAKFNWCAYGSDFPPNVTFDKGVYTF
ncbi:MAG: hypothetical protein LBB31_04660, partial [Prevotellaceae bacterium]|nr:hypothetical protein [Prevotellaceae bacterium]